MRALLFVLLFASSAAAQDAARLDKIEEAWREWLGPHRVGESALAVARGEAILLDVMRGGVSGAPAPLASLSKALTAVCVRALVSEGKLSYDTQVSEYIAGAELGLSVAHLLTHSGGLWPDETQERMWDWVNDPMDRHPDVAEAALPRKRSELGSYRYNNENYAVLGAIIEAVTGESYQQACNTRVVEPLALQSAQRSPRYGAFLPWGGWEMSARDYAIFAESSFSGVDPATAPNIAAGGGARYGLGSLYFEAEGIRITWHTGLLCFGSIDGAGAYFVQVSPGYSVAVTFEGCPGEGALAALDQALLTAMLR